MKVEVLLSFGHKNWRTELTSNFLPLNGETFRGFLIGNRTGQTWPRPTRKFYGHSRLTQLTDCRHLCSTTEVLTLSKTLPVAGKGRLLTTCLGGLRTYPKSSSTWRRDSLSSDVSLVWLREGTKRSFEPMNNSLVICHSQDRIDHVSRNTNHP